MKLNVKRCKYITLGGDKGFRYIFSIDNKEIAEMSITNNGYDEHKNYHEYMVGDWLNIIAEHHWIKSNEIKNLEKLLQENEAEINHFLALSQIEKREWEIKSLQSYLIYEREVQ